MYVAYSEDKVYKDVGTKRQLFIDNDVIAVVKNVTRRQHTPAKHPDNPVIKRDKPWEAATYFRTSCFNVIRDPADGLFRCWYEDFYGYFGYQDQGPTLHERNFFAQSEDGLNWEKPALGKQIIDGRDTNAIFPHSEDEMFCTTSVMLDDRDPDPRSPLQDGVLPPLDGPESSQGQPQARRRRAVHGVLSQRDRLDPL